MQDKLQTIKRLDFFRSLDDEKLNTLASISSISKHPKSCILYYENDVQNKVLFLVSGLIKVYKIDKFDNEIFLYHIYENSLISELSTIDDDTVHCYSNTEFIQESLILEIDFLKFKEYFLYKNILNKEFINEILSRTKQLHSVVNRELVFDATAKVAYMLIEDLNMFNSLKRHEVSFMLHIQPETLSRVLKKLKRKDIIEVENYKISILNEPLLTSIYKGEQI